MIYINNIYVSGWESAIRGCRNPLNSWDRMDSEFLWYPEHGDEPMLGNNDLGLCLRLVKAGTEHRKFLRMIHISMDIKAPAYWVAEHDTYKISTTRNSCSFMHKGITEKFTKDDFNFFENTTKEFDNTADNIIETLNNLRDLFFKTRDYNYFIMIRNLLPQGYMIKYTWDCNMETLLNIICQRKGHRLPEWETFRQKMFENVPYLLEFYEVLQKENN